MTVNYVVYTGHDRRIVHTAVNNFTYVPVIYEKIPYFFMNELPPEEPFYNFSVRSMKNSFEYEKRLQATDKVKQSLEKQSSIITILENLNRVCRFYLRAYEGSFVNQYTQLFLYDEINKYNQSGEVGIILNSLVENNEHGYSVDDVVSMEMLKRDDVKHMLTYLHTLENKVRKMIREEKFEEANFFINRQKSKMRW